MATPRMSHGVSGQEETRETDWRHLYMSAVLECDSVRFQPCVKKAKDAIKALSTSNSGKTSPDELMAMRNALDVLDILYKEPNDPA